MGSKIKSTQKKLNAHNAYACILNMSEYMSNHSTNKKPWAYRDIIFRLHLDYDTHREIVKYKDQYYKKNPYLMEKISSVYKAMKKPGQNGHIRIQKIVDTVAQKVKKSPDKIIHLISPLSFSLKDKDYGNMSLKYVASRVIYDDPKYWDPEYEEDSSISILDFISKFKKDIEWDEDYNKLQKLIVSFGEESFFGVMKEMLENSIPIDQMDMVKLVLVIIGYVYGINSNALLGETNKMTMLEEVTGDQWREENVRYKILWLYELGIFSDLYKEDLDEVDKFKNILINAPLNKYNPLYKDLEYFCNKYDLKIDAITGKYLPINNNIPAMSVAEFKDKLRFHDIFLSKI